MPRVIRMEPEDVFIDLADSLRDMQEDFRTDVFMQLQRYIEEETQTKSAELCDRLPGDAESYRESIKFRVLEDTPERWVGELYSHHEWARAIEDGTEPHIIEARGGGIGVSEAKKYGKEKGWEIPKNWIPTEEISMSEMRKRSVRENVTPYYGTYNAEVRKRRRRGKSDTWDIKPGTEKIEIVVDPGYERTTREASQGAKAHEYLHAIMQRTRGKTGPQEATYHHAHTALVDERTDARTKKGDKGYMFIQDWLPERGGGKNSQTPPYGSKYRKDPQRFQKVEHPGARAFHIFRDTGKHVSDKIETLLSRMQTMLFEKMKRSS